MTQDESSDRVIRKLATGIPGLDTIAHCGLPEGRMTLLSGTAGSAKSLISAQFLAEGIRQHGQSGVLVTFEEPPGEIRRNMLGLGWDIARWEAQGKWAFVDASPQPGQRALVAGDYDFGALLARIEYAVGSVGAARIVMDSLGAIFSEFDNGGIVRSEIFRIANALKEMEVTSILTAERIEEYGHIARFGVEEFVADNVIILRNLLESERRRRTMEILKFRGTTHNKGEYPFTIIPGQGVTVVPISAMKLEQKSTELRVTSGVPELDEMCGGGFFRDSVILISGATGTGKTLTVTSFLQGGLRNGERCLLFGFEESRDQFFRNARGGGIDFAEMEASGQLRVVCAYPETMGLEDHLVQMRDTIAEFRPDRLAVDSLSALERVSTVKGFREFVIGLTSFIKDNETAGMFTSTTEKLMGGASITEAHISTITDSIILLRYVETFGEMRRGITVLKMRGSSHVKEIRAFTIDPSGMTIGRAFRNVSGILAGNPTASLDAEIGRVDDLFRPGAKDTLGGLSSE